MKFKAISLKRHLIFTLGIFVIPMIFCLLLYNYYSIKAINNEVAQSGKNTIILYQSTASGFVYSLKGLIQN